MKNITAIITVSLLLCFYNESKAQIAPNFANITIPETSCVFCVVQDEKGLVWAGTQNGLYCYDGYNAYTKRTEDRFSNTIVYSLSNRGDSIYMGTDKGFLIYNDRKNSYRHIFNKNPKDIRAILRVGENILLGASEGLYIYQSRKGTIKLLSGKIRNVHSLAISSRGILVGSRHGLYLYRKGVLGKIDIKGVNGSFINSILRDNQRKDFFYIGKEGAFYSYNMQQGSLTPYIQIQGNSIKSMAQDRKGVLYIGTDNGLYVKTNHGFSHFIHNSCDSRTIGNNIIWSVTTDCNNNVWMGTDIGISFVKKEPLFKYQTIDQFTKMNIGNTIHYFFRDSRNRFWIAGTSGLILVLPNGKCIWYRLNSSNYPISHNRIHSVYEDHDHNIWIATDHGLNLYDETSRQMKNFIVFDRHGKYSCCWAYFILEDAQKRMWISAYDGGIFIISKHRLLTSKGIVTADIHIKDEGNQLQGLHVGQMVTDKKGHIWAVTNQGLDRINTTALTISHVYKGPVHCLCTDSHGNVWAGLNGKVIMYSYDGKTIKDYDLKTNSSQNEILSLNSVNGEIWAITENECFVIHSPNMADVFNIPFMKVITSYYSTLNYQMYFGGNDGIMTIEPDKLKNNSNSQALLLTQMNVNGKTVIYMKSKLISSGKIVLKHNQNNLELYFSDLPYLKQYSQLYVYRLEGIDHVWRILDPETYKICYDGLPSGNYNLTISVVDGYGKIQATVFSSNIQICPPLYLTWWAKIIYILLSIFLICWMIRFYLIKLKLRDERQARTHIMEQSLNRINFYNHLSCKIQESLGAIMVSVHYMIRKSSITSKSHEQLMGIHHQGTVINTFIRELFDMEVDSQKISHIGQEIDIVSFCCQMIEEMKPYATAQNIDLVFTTQIETFTIEGDITEWNSILNILLNYTIHHSLAKSIATVSIENNEESESINILVGSTAMKIPSSIKPYIFQRYMFIQEYTGEDNALYLVEEYAEHHKGKVSIKTGITGGDFFSLVFPFNIKLVKQQYEKATELDLSEQFTFKDDKDAKFMNTLIDIICKNIDNSDFNVTKLQETLGIGDKMLYRKVKQITGITPVEYIRDIRLKRAAMLLKKGKFTISEVMYMVGFSNSGYFSKCFQNMYGMTPTMFAKI